MRIGFAGRMIGLALGLPLLAGVADRPLPRGSEDTVVAVVAAATETDARRPPVRRAGTDGAGNGLPCRRSAADPLDTAPPARHSRGPHSGCTLRLVKRQPADALIWV